MKLVVDRKANCDELRTFSFEEIANRPGVYAIVGSGDGQNYDCDLHVVLPALVSNATRVDATQKEFIRFIIGTDKSIYPWGYVGKGSKFIESKRQFTYSN